MQSHTSHQPELISLCTYTRNHCITNHIIMSFWTVGLSRVLTSFCTWNNVYIFYIYGFLLCEGNLITNVCRTGVSGWRFQLDCCFKLQCDVIVNRQISLHISDWMFLFICMTLFQNTFFFCTLICCYLDLICQYFYCI